MEISANSLLLTDKCYILKLIADIFAAITYQSSGQLYKTLNCVYTMHKEKKKICNAVKENPLKSETVYTGHGMKRQNKWQVCSFCTVHCYGY